MRTFARIVEKFRRSAIFLWAKPGRVQGHAVRADGWSVTNGARSARACFWCVSVVVAMVGCDPPGSPDDDGDPTNGEQQACSIAAVAVAVELRDEGVGQGEGPLRCAVGFAASPAAAMEKAQHDCVTRLSSEGATSDECELVEDPTIPGNELLQRIQCASVATTEASWHISYFTDTSPANACHDLSLLRENSLLRCDMDPECTIMCEACSA